MLDILQGEKLIKIDNYYAILENKEAIELINEHLNKNQFDEIEKAEKWKSTSIIDRTHENHRFINEIKVKNYIEITIIDNW